MTPKGRTSPVPRVSIATVESMSLPSRGRSCQNEASEGRGWAAVVTALIVLAATDRSKPIFWGHRGRITLVERNVRQSAMPGHQPGAGGPDEQEVDCADGQGQVVRRGEGLRLPQRRRGR